MFESFEWIGLNDVPVSPYKDFVYDIKILEGYDKLEIMKQLYSSLKQTDYSLYKLQRRFAETGNKEAVTLVIKNDNADDNTYLIFDYKTLEGQARPNDISKITAHIKSIPDIQSVNLTSENVVYKISDKDYKDLLIKQIKVISREILLSNIDISLSPKNAQSKLRDISVMFALEQSLPREGTIIRSGQIDRLTVEWVNNMLEFEHKLGYLTIDKEVIAKINEQTHRYAEEKSRELSDYLNR